MKTKAAAITLTHRRARALELRVSGHSFREIAEQLGTGNPGSAYKDVQRALSVIVLAPAREALVLELHRLDEIVRAIWPKVTDGDIPACRIALACLARRSAYLGLDSPARLIVVAEPPMMDDEQAYEEALRIVNETLGPPPPLLVAVESNGTGNDQAGQRRDGTAHQRGAASP